jgi:Na+-driven multidrug efflux pump
MGQEPEVALIAGHYIRGMFPGLLFMGLFDANKTFLNSMDEAVAPTFIQACGIPMHFIWCTVLTPLYGYMGVCYSMNITYFTLLAGLSIYSGYLGKI